MAVFGIVCKKAKPCSRSDGGEYFFRDDEGFERQESDLAIETFVRESARIERLRGTIAGIIPSKHSVLIEKVLDCHNHIGDRIWPEEFPQLRAELDYLEAHCDERILTSFVEDFPELISVATIEGNPIVFA